MSPRVLRLLDCVKNDAILADHEGDTPIRRSLPIEDSERPRHPLIWAIRSHHERPAAVINECSLTGITIHA